MRKRITVYRADDDDIDIIKSELPEFEIVDRRRWNVTWVLLEYLGPAVGVLGVWFLIAEISKWV